MARTTKSATRGLIRPAQDDARIAKIAAGLGDERRSEFLGVLWLGFSMLLFLVLVTDGFPKLGLNSRPFDDMISVPNLLSWPGSIVAGILSIAFGDAAHTLWVVTAIWGFMLLGHRPFDRKLQRLSGIFFLTGAIAGLLQIDLAAGRSYPDPGGLIGSFVADQFRAEFGVLSSSIMVVMLALIGVVLTTDFLLVRVFVGVQRAMTGLIRSNITLYENARHGVAGMRAYLDRRRIVDDEEEAYAEGEADYYEEEEEAPARARAEKPEKLDKRAAAIAARAARRSSEPLRINTGPGALPETPFPSVRAKQEDLPFDTADDEDEVPDAEAYEEDLDVEADGYEDDAEIEEEEEAPLPPLPVAAAKPPAPTKKLQLELVPREADPPARRLVRKPKKAEYVFDEIPEDYEYPRVYTKPPLDIFDLPEPRAIVNLKEQLQEISTLLEETLFTFGIEARVTDVTRGPTITRFELEPAPGVKVSRFLALADDLALALKAHRIRVEAPIPGKGRVGIEVPNVDRDQVLLRELMESKAFNSKKGKLNLSLGKDITGEVTIADLAGMPHLLVAGATGAGKTVCVKALLASLLCAKTPDELQLVLIDPKMVELSIFNDIPHLITPVVTEPKKAATSLQWLINEMEERYRLFADLRVRNIEVYNQSVENGEIVVEGDEDNDSKSMNVIRRLPYIVCVIDELADLMMLARAEVEDCIARLAQLARAVGIHMIIATQRPSVDVLTGVIKANFPARVSFQVSSRVDSRCILDEIGAERLIGMGDMLYLPAGQSKPVRIQGAFVGDDEMNALIGYLKTQAPPQYKDEIENYGKAKEKISDLIDDDDPLLDEAVQVVFETGQASISMVQRRLRVGYTRAARLIDMMELKGIVGPHTGSKAREILVSGPIKESVD